MAENNENVNVTEEVDTNTDIMSMINDTRQNMVSKALYDKAMSEKAQLAKALLDTSYVEPTQVKTVRSSQEIAEDFFKAADKDNRREAMSLALEYREARQREAGIDPFVPNSPAKPATQSDFDEADRQATIMADMIENTSSEDDFLLEYGRRVKFYKP